MPTVSRCFTVRPTAAAREGLSVLVIDRSASEAEQVVTALCDDGHAVQVHTHDDDLETLISALNPQVIMIRMRLSGACRTSRERVRSAFPHIHLLTFNASTADAVRKQIPKQWTDLVRLSAARMPRTQGFPRAVREALEQLMSA